MDFVSNDLPVFFPIFIGTSKNYDGAEHRGVFVDELRGKRCEIIIRYTCDKECACDDITVIRRVENDEYKLLQEKRYLCYESWDDIALDLNCSVSWTLKLHRRALRAVDAVLAEISNEDSKVH